MAKFSTSNGKPRRPFAPLKGMSGFNHDRLLEPIGYIPPGEANPNYYRQLASEIAEGAPELNRITSSTPVVFRVAASYLTRAGRKHFHVPHVPHLSRKLIPVKADSA